MTELNFANASNKEVADYLRRWGVSSNDIDTLFAIYGYRVRNPKNYPTTEQITRLLCAFSLGADPGESREDKARELQLLILTSFANSKVVPWYWLGEDLAHDLSLTDMPDSISADLILPKQGIIVLPNNLIESDTGKIRFVAYKIYIEEEDSDSTLEYMVNGEKVKVGLDFGDLTGSSIYFLSLQDYGLYGGNFELLKKDGELIIGKDSVNSLIDGICNKLATILLNSLVYSSQNESEIDYRNPIRKIGSKFKDKPSKRPREPLFIGANYQSQIRYIKSESSGTGTSKTPHWRRGHWRRTPCGEGRKQRAWTLIKPTLVGLSN